MGLSHSICIFFLSTLTLSLDGWRPLINFFLLEEKKKKSIGIPSGRIITAADDLIHSWAHSAQYQKEEEFSLPKSHKSAERKTKGVRGAFSLARVT